MKNAILYFLRMDVFQKASRVLVIVMLVLFFLFIRTGAAGATGIVLCVIGIAVFGVGCALKVPKESDITVFISQKRTEFEKQTRKEYKPFRMHEYRSLYAFTEEKKYLVRTLGNRLIYPVCLNLMFVLHDGMIDLATEMYALYQKEPSVCRTHTFDATSPLTVQVLRMEGDAEMLLVTLCGGTGQISRFYVRDDHTWKQLCEYLRGHAVFEDVTE